jgi:poly(3-hydroxyalkanoate) synthetase
VLDLPGVFYRQAVDWIFRENRLACGRFPALGETIDLARVYCPLFLLAGREDEVVSPGQLTSIASLVGTPADSIETRIVRGNHLSLFMGRLTLADEWPELAEFLSRAPPR